jgi:hypothetical protein
MSSSGLIYAFIVGAWAVYLVPMWLRREDELNKARQTQRYTAAIKVLSNKDSFERRYGAVGERAAAQDEEQAQELPLAAGQSGSAPAAGQGTLDRVKARDRDREREAAGAPSTTAGTAPRSGVGAAAGTAARPAPRAKAAFAAESATSNVRRTTVSAKVTSADATDIKRAKVTSAAATDTKKAGVWTPPPARPTAPSAGLGPRSGLRARRRRVVGFLFALTSLGAIVSADLGLSFVWAMLLPAAALSAYIVWVRKDERARTAERARRGAAAARAAHEAAEHREHELRREQDEVERLEREELARRSTAARRRTAAARSRAERRTTPGLPDQGDLPRAANG